MSRNPVPDDIDPRLHDEIVELLADPLTSEEDAAIEKALRGPVTKSFGRGAGVKEREARTSMVSVRLNDKMRQAVKYWAEKQESSVSEFITDAIGEKIARINGDYELPTLEVARQAQLIDEVKTLSVSVANLETSFSSMIESIATMARNPSYMSESMRSVENG